MPKQKGIKVINEDIESVYANTFKVNYTETEFIINFAKFSDEECSEVNVVSKIMLPPKMVVALTSTLYSGAQRFQEQFGKNIGIPEIKQANNSK